MTPTYDLTPEAEKDHDEIINYSLKHFGVDQTIVLDDALRCGMEDVGRNPEHGFKREEITEGLGDVRFRVVKKSFRLVYLADTRPVQIVRILYGSRDVRSKI